MDVMKESLNLHRKLKGKIEIKNTYDIKDKKDLSLVYTPGVASSCLAIKENPEESYQLTGRKNTVAVITDGTAVLGLGDIGPLAAMPVMEGKCAIFKEFAGINAIPIVLDTKDVDELVKTITYLAPSFGGINLEDISAPRCFEVEKRLRDILDIPVFHDDQHGTAIAVGAALINALRLIDTPISKAKVIINGAGSAGVAISRFLLELGFKNLVVCDKSGILDQNDRNINHAQLELAIDTNPNHIKGSLSDALKEANVFIGVSAGNVLNKEMIKKMDKDPIVFALANPTPEISRDDAVSAGVKIYGSGLSNMPNQINNALVFPGLFKGALAHPVKQIDFSMEKAACHALARLVSDDELTKDYIIPDVFNKDVVKVIFDAIMNVKLK
ncbi:MAG: NADP-dependent malic enzyme [Acholeplasmataceae bacterium]|nr:NADP-dependent malic enzyme [Acholeplasmataceae bacterium]